MPFRKMAGMIGGSVVATIFASALPSMGFVPAVAIMGIATGYSLHGTKKVLITQNGAEFELLTTLYFHVLDKGPLCEGSADRQCDELVDLISPYIE